MRSLKVTLNEKLVYLPKEVLSLGDTFFTVREAKADSLNLKKSPQPSFEYDAVAPFGTVMFAGEAIPANGAS